MEQKDKTNLLLITVAAIFGILYGLSDTKQQPATSENKPKEITFVVPKNQVFSEQQITAALEILKAGCPRLFNNYADDIEQAEITSYDTDYMYFKESYGWNKLIEVDIKLNNKPEHIPDNYRAWGHTLHFYLGSGDVSGIVTDKRQTQQICNWEVSANGDNMLHEISGLEILK